MTLPLSGLKVLDVSAVLAAPISATFLADFGADVVKIEQPRTGDFTRRGATEPGGRSPQWVQEGRNKKSVTLNLRAPEAQEMLHALIPQFDVVVTNYRLPTLVKWRMDPETLQRLHPRGIFAFVTGYGLTGPYRDRGAFDRVASAFSGLSYVSGEADRPPVRSGYAVIDYMTAYLAVAAIMTALYHRDCRGGTGQFIDLALYEAGFRASEDALIRYSATGEVRERVGNRNRSIVPADDFTTLDGRRVSIHAGTAPLFRRLADAMRRPALAEDPRFATDPARVQNQDALYDVIAAWAATLNADDLVDLLTGYDIPASMLLSVADIAVNPHYRSRGTFVEVDDAEYGRLMMAGPLPKLSRTPGAIRFSGRELGADNADVYRDLLGLDDCALAELHGRGVL